MHMYMLAFYNCAFSFLDYPGYLVLPFRVYNCKVLSCGQMFNATSLPPRERLTWTNRESVFHNLLLFHFVPLAPSLSLSLFPSPSSSPPSFPLTTAGVTFLLKLPVGVGRSGGCLQNAMVRMALATVDYEKCEHNISTVTCNESISYESCQELINHYTPLCFIWSYSAYHPPQLQGPQQRSPQQQYSTHTHGGTASLYFQPDELCEHCDI